MSIWLGIGVMLSWSAYMSMLLNGPTLLRIPKPVTSADTNGYRTDSEHSMWQWPD